MPNPSKKLLTTCVICITPFLYSPKQQGGIYCSNTCAGEGKRLRTAERFADGLVTERDTIRRLLTEQRGYSCAVCDVTEWMSKPITLQVDHVDGNPSNNMPNNLRLICPNCHSQTPHFGGRNKGRGRRALGLSPR